MDAHDFYLRLCRHFDRLRADGGTAPFAFTVIAANGCHICGRSTGEHNGTEIGVIEDSATFPAPLTILIRDAQGGVVLTQWQNADTDTDLFFQPATHAPADDHGH